MRITQDIRDYAKAHGLDAAQGIAVGLDEKAREFREAGGKLYLKA